MYKNLLKCVMILGAFCCFSIGCNNSQKNLSIGTAGTDTTETSPTTGSTGTTLATYLQTEIQALAMVANALEKETWQRKNKRSYHLFISFEEKIDNI